MDLTRRDLTGSSIYLPLTTFVRDFDRKIRLLTSERQRQIFSRNSGKFQSHCETLKITQTEENISKNIFKRKMD